MTRRKLVAGKLTERGMIQTELARQLGVSTAYLTQLLNGQRGTAYSWMYWSERIASLLKMTHRERTELKGL